MTTAHLHAQEGWPLATPPPDAPPAKSPMPPQAEQQKLLETLDEIYELGKQRTPEETAKLIDELLASADDAAGKPTDQFVLLRKSMELANGIGDAERTLEIVDRIAESFQIDPMITKGKMLGTVAAKVNTPDQIASLMNAANGYIDQAIALKRFDYAVNIAALVYRKTQSPQGKNFRKDALDRQREVQKLQADYQKLAEALRAAQANPADAEAALTVGQLYCFSYDDWQRGLPFLARGSDPTFAALAALEIANPVEAAAQAKVGDGWWDLAGSKKDREKDLLMRRAVSWYEKAQAAGATGLAKVKIEKRLAEFAKLEEEAAAKLATKPGGSSTPRRVTSNVPKGPVAMFTFDKATIARDGEQFVAKDLSGKWQPAKLIGGTLVPGVAGEGFKTAAGNAYVDLGIPHVPVPKSVCFWAKSDKAGVSSLLFGYIADPVGNRFYIGTDSAGVLGLGLGGSAWQKEGKVKLDTNWHHYAVVFDGARMGLFLDGKPCGIKQGTHQAGGSYFLGVLCSAGKPYRTGFHGAVDEFVAYDRVLTPKEVWQIFELGAKGKSLK
jgi:hypothetical protein